MKQLFEETTKKVVIGKDFAEEIKNYLLSLGFERVDNNWELQPFTYNHKCGLRITVCNYKSEDSENYHMSFGGLLYFWGTEASTSSLISTKKPSSECFEEYEKSIHESIELAKKVMNAFEEYMKL